MSFGSPSDNISQNQPGGSSGSCCTDEQLNDILNTQLDAIVQVLRQIEYDFEQLIKGPCSNIDECIDEISDKLKQKWQTTLADCETCKSMAAEGLGGTIEYALACAGVTCQEAAKSCSMGDASTWGKPCEGCGSDPCCCNQGVCEPCEEPQQKKHRYIGWCSPTTGLFVASRDDEDGPGGDYNQVALEDTEEVALQVASEYCNRMLPPQQPRFQINYPVGLVSTQFCPIGAYASGSVIESLTSQNPRLNIQAGVAQFANQIADIGAFGVDVGSIGSVLAGLWSAFTNQPLIMADTVMPAVTQTLGCSDPQFTQLALTLASFDQVQKLSGIDFHEYLQPYTYAMNSVCRRKFLDPGQATMAYFANAFDYNTLDTHFAINGFCPEATEWHVQASKSKPIPDQLARMRLRGMINQQGYADGMRQLGYLEPATAEQLFGLYQQLPTLSDIIRLMVRDADDDQVAKQFGLDDLFQQKYQQQLRTWSEQQGVPEKFAQYAWRAHWQIPSPTALFEFNRRLRKLPQFGGEQAVLNNIKSALIQQDILPFWHDYYLAISYVPLNRTDLRRGYEIGTISDDELEQGFSVLGYSDDDVARQVKFTQRLRANAVVSHRFTRMWLKLAINRQQAVQRLLAYGYPQGVIDQGLDDAEHGFITSEWSSAFLKGDINAATLTQYLTGWGVSGNMANQIAQQLALRVTSHPSLDAYVVGIKTRVDAMNDMQQWGMNTDVVNRLLDRADQHITHTFTLKCQNGIRKRYLLGELTNQEATNELLANNVVNDRANLLVSNWQCERGAFGRSQSVAKLCQWLAQGTITTTDYMARLQRFGYSPEDAARLQNDCLISTNQKLLRQAQREAKEQAAQDLRTQRLLAKQAAQEQQALAKQQRAVNQRAATTNRRYKQLLSAAEKMAAKCNCSINDTLPYMKEQQQRLYGQYGLSTDETLSVLLLSVESWQGGSQDSLTPLIDEEAQTVVASALSPPIDPLSGVVITSG